MVYPSEVTTYCVCPWLSQVGNVIHGILENEYFFLYMYPWDCQLLISYTTYDLRLDGVDESLRLLALIRTPCCLGNHDYCCMATMEIKIFFTSKMHIWRWHHHLQGVTFLSLIYVYINVPNQVILDGF